MKDDGYKLYTPYSETKKKHYILRFLFRLIVDAVILGLLGWGLFAGGSAIGFKMSGALTFTAPWGASVTIGDAKYANKPDKNSTVKKNTDDGTADNADKKNDPGKSAASLDETEKALTDFKPVVGNDGTYRDAASQLVKLAGADIKWNLQNIPCEGTANSTTVAIYCPATPDVIYVNESHQDYETIAKSTAFIDDIKHELAHRAIDAKCKTTDPDVAKGRTEAIANSYAVLYFGASRSSFDNTNTIGLKTPLAYVPDAESDGMAGQVHSGACTADNADTSSSTGSVGD